jgi:acetyl-CoA carboxylase biotin carboxylase subunit
MCCRATACRPNYDSMIGKLICWADTREQAIERTSRALHEFEVGPIKTTIPLHHG